MSCSTQGTISLDQALLAYEQTKVLPIIELALIQAHSHVLAEDVFSTVCLPLFTQSAVDGYALKSQDIETGIRNFKLVGEIRAGENENINLQSGEMLRIFTGAKLPASADTVARQEIVTANQKNIQLNEIIIKGTDIRYQGEELQAGSLLAQKGTKLSSGLIAALSMAGVQMVKVYRPPKIVALITGDEVSQERQHDAQVFDANTPMIISWFKEQGFAQIDVQHVMDNETDVQHALEHALQHYDLVITTGGVSVGDYDLIRPISLQLGAQEVFWKVAQKPGKPLFFASYQQDKHQAYLIGLPGNPAAVMVCLIIHVATLLRALQGQKNIAPAWQTAELATNVRQDAREQLLRMVAQTDAFGKIYLTKLDKQQSHMLSNLAEANVIARIPTKNHSTDQNLQYVQYLPI